MSFTKRLREALGGEDPRETDVERQAAEELRRARGPAGGPGAAGAPSPPGSGPPGQPSSPPPGGSSFNAPAPPSGPAPGPNNTPPPGPQPGPGTSPPPEAPTPPSASPGGAPAPVSSSSPGEAATPEEERQALNEMALEDLGGSAADGGLQVDPAQAEAMRDRALAQYMQRKEEFDRFRQQEAQRRDRQQTQSEPSQTQPRGQQGPMRLQNSAQALQGQAQPQTEEDPELDELHERLGALPGVTRTKLEALLNEFDSIEALEQASEDELVQVDGIGQRLAAKIVRALQ